MGSSLALTPTRTLTLTLTLTLTRRTLTLTLALTRWALIASYRDASVDDTCRVFPRPRAVLRRKCKALGQQTVISSISRPYLAHISPL